MVTVAVYLPDLKNHEAGDLVRTALKEWADRRNAETYVDRRYAAMSAAFREKRQELLLRQLDAIDAMALDIIWPYTSL